jgi:ubiquinone/menaquinone biosynthesis C-methylase UbiE
VNEHSVIRNLDHWSQPNVAEHYENEHQGIAGDFIRESETQPIIAAILDQQPERILDAGCGTGRHLVDICDRDGLYGIDYSDRMLEVAREKVPKGDFSQGSIHETPYADGFFDMVICIRVLQHVDDLNPVFREFQRILASGGEAHILVYNRWTLHALAERFRQSGIAERVSRSAKEKGYWKRLHRGMYNRFYSPRELIDAAKASGFEEVGIRGATAGMAWLLHASGVDRLRSPIVRRLLSVYIRVSRAKRELFRSIFPFNYFFDTYILVCRKR